MTIDERKNAFFANNELLKKEFGDATISDRDQSHYMYIKIQYNNLLKKRMRIDTQIEVCSIISVGYNDYYESINDFIPIDISINFAWFSKKDNAYPLTMPKESKVIWAPRNIDKRKKILWDYTTNSFFDLRRNRVEIVNEIKKYIKYHQVPIHRFRGFINRLSRKILWYPIRSIFNFISQISIVAFKATSGKDIKIEDKEYVFKYLLSPETKVRYKIAEAQDKGKIIFYGISTSIYPLVIYSIINLGIYCFLFVQNKVSPFIDSILKNTFLTLLYVVVSYAVLQLMVSKPFLWLLNMCLFIIGKIDSNKVYKYSK